jgi:hypothetical protein
VTPGSETLKVRARHRLRGFQRGLGTDVTADRKVHGVLRPCRSLVIRRPCFRLQPKGRGGRERGSRYPKGRCGSAVEKLRHGLSTPNEISPLSEIRDGPPAYPGVDVKEGRKVFGVLRPCRSLVIRKAESNQIPSGRSMKRNPTNQLELAGPF